MPVAKPKTPVRTNAMIDRISPERRAALEALQKLIRKAAPAAVESETYGARGFRVDGVPVVATGASAKALSLYVMSAGVIAAFAEELDELGFRYSKGAVQFTPEKPLPAALVRRIVKARLAENAALKAARKAKPKASPRKKT